MNKLNSNRSGGVLLPMIAWLFAAGCAHETSRVGLYPATSQVIDVFTCKGLDEGGHWIEVTDSFIPDEDPYVIVAAQLRENHRRGWITYELTSPADFVVVSETVRYPKETDLGIHFDISRLMEMGGEGKWTAVVYADGTPLGKAVFTIGEEKEELAGLSQYHVISQEDLPSEPVQPPAEDTEAAQPSLEEGVTKAAGPGTEIGAQEGKGDTSQPTPASESPRK